MAISDPVGDMITRIRNANIILADKVDIPCSALKKEIAHILKDEGYVEGYKVIEDTKQNILRVTLKYTPDRKKVLCGLKRVSKPGLRRYVTAKKIPRVLRGLGTAILSTSKGVLTGEQARRNKVGGELLCIVW